MRKNQSGFSLVEVCVIVVVLVLVGFVGYTVVNRSNDKSQTTPTSQASKQSATANDVAEAPAVASTDDLNTAASTLDSMDVDSQSDTARLDAELAAF